MKYNQEYKKLVKHILDNGIEIQSRNSKTLAIPHYSFTIDDMENDHKLLLRKMFYKGVNGEFDTLIDYMNPLTNVKQFEEHGCNYWSNWATDEGDLNLDYYNELHPTLERVIQQIKLDPNSRRHVVSLWNNEHAFNGSLSLHSCWHNLTFSVINGILHMTWTQRSCDQMVGIPSDVYLAYLFMDYVAKLCDLDIGSCMFSLSNVHIYESHIESAKELLTRSEEDYDKVLKFELKA